jgi:DNA-binding transcriptional ArsR family regulator
MPEEMPFVVRGAALKALAHPLRIQLLGALEVRGRATATQLAADLGESSGATSYHLRQLHRHGFVEDDPDQGSARERWWRPRTGGWDLPATELLADAGSAGPTELVMIELLDKARHRAWEYLRRAPEWPADWQAAALRSSAHLDLAAAQAAALGAELSEVVARYRAQQQEPGARRVAVEVNVFPLGAPPDDPGV